MSLKFERGIIVSCQPRKGGFFDYEEAWKFAGEAIHGGAIALRIEGLTNIMRVSDFSEVPIIGLVKQPAALDMNIHITPSASWADRVRNCRADYVAVDATGYDDYIELKKTVEQGNDVIGDVATIEQAIIAQELGCVAVTTALAGYTQKYKVRSPFEAPDYMLLEKCCKELSIPVIAEGRYQTLKAVERAFKTGAYAVCIGGAITLPHLMTQMFRIPYEQVVCGKYETAFLNDYPKARE